MSCYSQNSAFSNAPRRVARLAGRLASKLAPWLSGTTRPRSDPRAFPSHGFDIIDDDFQLDEESFPGYSPGIFYPVQLGHIYNGRYQAVTKLGFGSCSTIWLARDLQEHRYITLKFYIHNSLEHRELPFYERLGQVVPSRHAGAARIRKLLSSFKVAGPHGTHIVLVLEAAQMCLAHMDMMFMKGRGFDEGLVRSAVQEMLYGLDFLHTHVQAVHTDIHAGNLLLGAQDDSIFKKLADEEMAHPSCRKPCADRTIYSSRLMKPQVGPLLLSDFGEARLGPGPHAGHIMPVQYRAPEVLLWIQWSYEVDIWSVGLTAWQLLEGKTLFTVKRAEDHISDSVILSQLVAVLGPPPQELLKHNPERSREYWDDDGTWHGIVPIPWEKTMEAAETKLEDKSKFLQFMRRTLAWDPSKRPTARELLDDPWLVEDSEA
ncbi:hypothetical protein E4U43_007261 [Claviceps pusilla]|uniref:non-specific serine/threonine protein kinase n=1 Tax=Claviceps pusilla TaxID=123648 RepID=A0A9P7T3Q8_9HYPO|nr:hypothetical protein E4U43_007261 [Claviceps pusilla]